MMVFKKKEVEPEEPFIECAEVMDANNQVEEFMNQLTPDMVQAFSAAFQQNDFTANTITHTALEESPDAITILTDLIKKSKDGGIEVIEDDHGNWLEFIGAKGYIPPYMMEYNRAANHNSIVTTLVDDCYEITYETDPDTGIIKNDDYGDPIVLRRVAVNVGTQRRNLNQSCELASSGARATLQAKVLGAISGTSPIGMDGTWDKALQDGFLRNRSRR